MTQVFKSYWTIGEDLQNYHDSEYETEALAIEAADAAFTEECEGEGIKTTASCDILLIEFVFDDDGEKKIIQSKPHKVEFEYYHGDFAEHNTIGR